MISFTALSLCVNCVVAFFYYAHVYAVWVGVNRINIGVCIVGVGTVLVCESFINCCVIISNDCLWEVNL